LGSLQFYTVYGFRLASDFPFPGLREEPPTAAHEAVDVVLRVRRGSRIHEIQDGGGEVLFDNHPSTGGGLTVVASETGVLFRYAGVAFLVDPQLREVSCRAASDCGDELIRQLFLGLVAAFVVNARGGISLHAAAVRVGSQAIAFVAEAGGGKSSLASSFVGAGDPLVSDDLLALEWDGGRLWAFPGPPQLRLWPDSAGRLLWGGAGVVSQDPVRPGKRHVALPSDARHYADRPLVLRSVYVVERAPAARLRIQAMSQGETLIFLVGSIHANFLSSGDQLRAQFDLLTQAVRTLTARRLLLPAGLDGLPAARSLIAQEMRPVPQVTHG
jgi:hypothetical protein